MGNKEFITQNLLDAGVLKALGVKLLRLEKKEIKGYEVVFFVFDNTDGKAEKMYEDAVNGRLELPMDFISKLISAYSYLKTKIKNLLNE